jgi:hypothetical protein
MGSLRECQAPRMSNSVESRRLLHTQVVLRFWLLSDAPHRLQYRASGRNAVGLVPLVHGGGRITNAVDTVSQDSRPTRYNYNDSCKSRHVM